MRSIVVDVRYRAHAVFVFRRVIHILGASKASVAALLLLQLPQQALVSSGGHVSWLFSESKTMMAVRVRFIHRTRPRPRSPR